MARQQGAMLECHRLLCIRVEPIVHQKVTEKQVRQRKSLKHTIHTRSRPEGGAIKGG